MGWPRPYLRVLLKPQPWLWDSSDGPESPDLTSNTNMRLSLNARLGLVLGAALALGALATPAEAAHRARHTRITRSADDHAMHRRARARANVQSRRRSAYYLLR